MSKASLCVLGPPGLQVGKEPVHLDRKPLALLVWLSLTGEAVSRTVLADLFWPESPQAGVNLRKALFDLRRTCGGDLLVDHRAHACIALAPEGLDCDVGAFRRLLARGLGASAEGEQPDALEAAIGLYRGDFLEGFSLPDAPDFDDWQRLQTDHLRLQVQTALGHLARRAAADGAMGRALELARRRLDIDPLDEAGHRLLMRILAAAGDHGAALRQYAVCEQQVQAGFGTLPDARTQRLREELLAGRNIALDAGPAPSRPAAGAPIGLLERPRSPGMAGPGSHPAARAAGSAPAAVSPPGPPSVRAAPERTAALRQAMELLLSAALGEDPGPALERLDLSRLSRLDPLDLVEYRLSRLARWCGPEQRLHLDFVGLSVLADHGSEQGGPRWRPRPERFVGLQPLLDALEPRALVLLGPPGSGKSTLLGRLEMDLCLKALRCDEAAVTVFVPLNRFALPEGDGEPDASVRPDAARSWLAARWKAQYPRLPHLEALLDAGRVTLLLDGLNEMPHRDEAAYRRLIACWRGFLADHVAAPSGNRAILTCRSLDFAAPLSSADLPVLCAEIAALDEAQKAAFLRRLAPRHGAEALDLAATDRGKILGATPFGLRVLAEYVEAGGGLGASFGGMLGALVRRGARRELERANPLFLPEGPTPLLGDRDARRLLASGAWPDAAALPEQGPLFPALAELAWSMQVGQGGGAGGQVAMAYGEALERIALPNPQALVEAGEALGILDEDLGRDSLQFSHQLWQEYFAARRLAARPDVSLLVRPWRRDEVRPRLEEVLAQLGVSDSLPPLPAGGLAESVILAVGMQTDPAAFVLALADADPVLAARCAVESGSPLDPLCRSTLRDRVLALSRHPAADLRARLAAGLLVGDLGDPRLVPCAVGAGRALLPDLVTLPAATYRLGGEMDDVLVDAPLPAFRMARRPVTNAEWACFIQAGGYEDERWWTGAAARAWQRGQSTADGPRAHARAATERFRRQPAELERLYREGHMPQDWYERFHERLALSADDLDQQLAALYPEGRLTEPRYWRDQRFRQSALPVVGICWYEARAYAAWLAVVSGIPFRLPTELEWEAAARGTVGRAYAFGDHFDPLACNSSESHLWQPSPPGIFPEGDSPEGIADLTGNVWEWTQSKMTPTLVVKSAAGSGQVDAPFDDAGDSGESRRVARGGAWDSPGSVARAAVRDAVLPGGRDAAYGLRLAADVDGPPR